MRLVADENLDAQIIERLRRDGHEVIFIAEMRPGISDTEVLAISREEDVILVTADKDFGELVFRQSLAHSGVVLLRLSGLYPSQKAQLLSDVLKRHGSQIDGCFVVVSQDSVRIRALT